MNSLREGFKEAMREPVLIREASIEAVVHRPNGGFLTVPASPPGAAALALAAALLLVGGGCAAINRQVDHWALEMKAEKVLGQQLTWRPGVELPYRTSAELERLTRPTGLPEVQIAPLRVHRQRDSMLIQEEVSFTSAIPLRLPESRVARAYVFRHGAWGERPVLLWVPGQNVSSADFLSLDRFFARALERGVDIVFFVPPYHLERTPQGYGSGDAFLATDFVDHLNAFAQELHDLRSLTAWIRAQGVRELGAFGSSMGGTMVLRLISWEPLFDFVTAMQPVIDWNALIRRPEMAPVRRRLAGQGVSDEDVMLVYHAIDPRTGTLQISPARLSLLYGRFDLIAPEGPILALKRRWGIKRVKVYDRGHAFITMGSRPFIDFGRSLDVDLTALRWRRFLESLGPWR
ncbi:MAG: hypothetical protein HY901_18170 [Deltaproteobacteria bacterium]|nr:hypothetical protein [Deltaproteobacteria bacterium]